MLPSFPSTDPIFSSKNGFNPQISPFFLGPEDVEKKSLVSFKKKLNFDDTEENFECDSPKKLHKEEDVNNLLDELSNKNKQGYCLLFAKPVKKIDE